MVEDNNAEVYSVFNNKLSPSIEFEQYLTRQDNDLILYHYIIVFHVTCRLHM